MTYRMIALFGIIAVAMPAAERKTLPDLKPVPLTGGIGVQSAASAEVQPAVLPSTGQWVLIYVDSDGGAGCRIVLNALQSPTPLPGIDRVVVIVSGPNPASREKVRELNPHLARALWFEDPDRSIFQALQLNHLPVTIGLRDSVVQWSVGGVTSPAEVRSRIAAWVGR